MPMKGKTTAMTVLGTKACNDHERDRPRRPRPVARGARSLVQQPCHDRQGKSCGKRRHSDRVGRERLRVAHGNEADGHTGYRSNIGKAEGQFHEHQNARDAEKCSNAPACARSGTVRVLPLKLCRQCQSMQCSRHHRKGRTISSARKGVFSGPAANPANMPARRSRKYVRVCVGGTPCSAMLRPASGTGSHKSR